MTTETGSYQHPTDLERSNWARLASAAYKAMRTSIGHRYSVAATRDRIATVDFDRLQNGFRRWAHAVESNAANPFRTL